MLTQECTYINSKRIEMHKVCKEVCDFFYVVRKLSRVKFFTTRNVVGQ